MSKLWVYFLAILLGGKVKRAEKGGLKENVGEGVLEPDPGGLYEFNEIQTG